jgi:hypothetical protein
MLDNPDELYRINPQLNREGFFPSCGGFRIRMHGPHPKGHVHPGGYHYIDHAHVLYRGAERIDWTNAKGESGSIVIEVGSEGFPVVIPILARCKHEMTTLVDGTITACHFSAHEAEEVYGDSTSVPWDQEDHRG